MGPPGKNSARTSFIPPGRPHILWGEIQKKKENEKNEKQYITILTMRQMQKDHREWQLDFRKDFGEKRQKEHASIKPGRYHVTERDYLITAKEYDPWMRAHQKPLSMLTTSTIIRPKHRLGRMPRISTIPNRTT